MRANRILLLAILLVAGTVFAGEVVDRVVAIVGKNVITLYDVDRAMAPYLDEIKRAPNRDEKYKTVKSEVINRLVDDLLMRQAIEDAKIEATNDDIARFIRDILSRSGVTLDALKSELASKGISYESYKEDLKRQIQRMKFIDQEIEPKVNVTEAELRSYYDKHMAEFGSAQSVHIAQIVLPFDESMDAEKAKALKAKASELVAQIRGGGSFDSLAKQYSKGPNAEKGGDLGIISPDLLMPEIRMVVEQMKIGEVSNPIVSPAGIHIVKLIDRAKATSADFSKLKDSIQRKLLDQKVVEETERFLDEQRKKSYVEIRE